MSKFKKGDKVLPKEGFLPIDSEPRPGMPQTQICEKITLTVKGSRSIGRSENCYLTFLRPRGVFDSGFFEPSSE
jgi:hypothetical protein